MKGKRLIDFIDPKLSETVDLMMDIFSGGDNTTFITFMQTLHTAEARAIDGDPGCTQLLMQVKAVGKLIKTCRRQP